MPGSFVRKIAQYALENERRGGLLLNALRNFPHLAGKRFAIQ